MSTIYQPFLIVTTNYEIARIFVNPENKNKSFLQLVDDNKEELQSESVLLSPVKNSRYFESFDYNIGYDKSEMFAINLNLVDVDYDFEEYFIQFAFQEERYREKIKKNFITKKTAEINSLGISAAGSVLTSDNNVWAEAQRTIRSKLSGYIYFIFGINDRPSTPIVSQFYKSEVTQSSDGFKKIKLNFINLGHPSLISELSMLDVDRTNFKVVEGEGFKKYEIYKYEGFISYKQYQKALDFLIRNVLRNLFTRITGQEVILLLPSFDKLFETYKKSYVPKGFLRIFTTSGIPGNSELGFLDSEFYNFLVFTEFLKELGFTIHDPLVDGQFASTWLTSFDALSKSGSRIPPEVLQNLDESLDYYESFRKDLKNRGLSEEDINNVDKFINNYKYDPEDLLAGIESVEQGNSSRGNSSLDAIETPLYESLMRLKKQGKFDIVATAIIQKRKLAKTLLLVSTNLKQRGSLGLVKSYGQLADDISDQADLLLGTLETGTIEEKITKLKDSIIKTIQYETEQNYPKLAGSFRANEQDWSDLNYVSSISPTGKQWPLEFYIIEKGDGTSDLDKLMPQKGNHINFEKFIADFSKKITKLGQNFNFKIGFFEENDLNRLLLLKNTCAYQDVSANGGSLDYAPWSVLQATLTLTAINPLPSGYPSTDYGPINRNYEILQDITNELRPTTTRIRGRLTTDNPPLLRQGQNVSRITFLNTTIMDAGGQIVPLGQNIQYPGTSLVTITRREVVYDQYDLDAFILSKPQNQQVKQQLQDIQRYSQDLERQSDTARDTYRNFLKNPGQFVTVAGQPIPAEVYWRREYDRLFRETIESKNRYEEVVYDLIFKERPNLVRVLEQKMTKEEWDIFERTGQGRQFPTTTQAIQNYNSSIWNWDGEYLPDQLAPGLARMVQDETRPVIVIGEEWLVRNLYYPTTIVKDDYGNYPVAEEDKLNYGPRSRYARALQRRKNYLSSVYKKNFLNSSFGEDVIESDVLDLLSDTSKTLATSSLFSIPVFTYNFKNSNILSFNLEVDKLNHTFSYHNLIQFQQKGIINEALEPIRRDIYDKLLNVQSLYDDLNTVLASTNDPINIDELIDITSKKLIGDVDEFGQEISLDSNSERDMLIDDLAKNSNLTREDYVRTMASRLVDDYLDDIAAGNPKASTLIKGTDIRLNPVLKRLQFLRDLYSKMYNLSIKTLPFFDLNNMERLYSGSMVIIKNIPNVISTPRQVLSYLTGIYRIRGFKHVITTTSAYSEFSLFKDPVVGEIEL